MAKKLHYYVGNLSSRGAKGEEKHQNKLKKAKSYSEAATKALRRAGRGSYELDTEK